MDPVPNQTKRRLAAGELALGMGARQARTVDIATIAKTCGFDWLFIDMEHSSMDVDLASQLAMASLGAGITPLVRVPGHEHYHASRLLDNGAQGIVAPHVDTVEEAQRIASACRYPPLGHRSIAGAQPQLGFRKPAGGRGDAHRQRGNAGRRHARDAEGDRPTRTRSRRWRASTCC